MKKESLEKIAEPLRDMTEEALNLLRLFASGEKRELIHDGQKVDEPNTIGPNYEDVLQASDCLLVYFSQLRGMKISTEELEKEYLELRERCDEIREKSGWEGYVS